MSLWRYHPDADEIPGLLADQKCLSYIKHKNGLCCFIVMIWVLLTALCHSWNSVNFHVLFLYPLVHWHVRMISYNFLFTEIHLKLFRENLNWFFWMCCYFLNSWSKVLLFYRIAFEVGVLEFRGQNLSCSVISVTCIGLCKTSTVNATF